MKPQRLVQQVHRPFSPLQFAYCSGYGTQVYTLNVRSLGH
jgi:hypothetical protein